MGFVWEYDKINLSDTPVDHKIVIRKFPYKIIPIQIPCVNIISHCGHGFAHDEYA